MKSKLAVVAVFSAAVALSALAGCDAPPRTGGTSSGGAVGSGGVQGSGGGGGGSGSSESGGVAGSGGAEQGGSVGAGGKTVGTGGNGNGGATTKGGSTGSGGGSVGSGGANAGGTAAKGGSTGSGGGSVGSGGANVGGTAAKGGSGGGPAGTTGSGGATATGGTTGTGKEGPCDIYQAANTPCVAAHSTVRALYAAYTGSLYQLRKKSDSSTKDVPVGADGYVDIATHDSFCPSGTACTISIIYDQSPNKNNLTKSPKGTWLPNGGNEANADLGKITINGKTAHGIYVDNDGGHTNPATDVGYRCVDTKGVAKGDEPEAMYAVFDGTRYSSICCFDYGNAEKAVAPGDAATMEAIYWGNSTQWARGGGSGPWVAADLELGMFEGDSTNTPTNTSVTGMKYVTAMLKGPSGNSMGLKAGNAQSGKLETKWNGKRPPGYAPKKLEGSIVLGTGGDGSDYGKGTFFEGVMTAGNPPDATDDLVQANIVAAGYGK
jgi:hypothetical protein